MKEAILAFIPFLVEFLFFYTQVFILFLLVLSIQFAYASYYERPVWWKKIDVLTNFKNPWSFLSVSVCFILMALFSLGLYSVFKIEKTLLISMFFQLSSFITFSMGLSCVILKNGQQKV